MSQGTALEERLRLQLAGCRALGLLSGMRTEVPVLPQETGGK